MWGHRSYRRLFAERGICNYCGCNYRWCDCTPHERREETITREKRRLQERREDYKREEKMVREKRRLQERSDDDKREKKMVREKRRWQERREDGKREKKMVREKRWRQESREDDKREEKMTTEKRVNDQTRESRLPYLYYPLHFVPDRSRNPGPYTYWIKSQMI